MKIFLTQKHCKIKRRGRSCLSKVFKDIYCRPYCWVRACVSMWTKSHKICKVWVLISQALPQYFCSYGLRLNKPNHRVKQVDISESTDINQLISNNRFYPVEALIFMWVECYLNKWKAWHSRCSILQLLIVI